MRYTFSFLNFFGLSAILSRRILINSYLIIIRPFTTNTRDFRWFCYQKIYLDKVTWVRQVTRVTLFLARIIFIFEEIFKISIVSIFRTLIAKKNQSKTSNSSRMFPRCNKLPTNFPLFLSPPPLHKEFQSDMKHVTRTYSYHVRVIFTPSLQD